MQRESLPEPASPEEQSIFDAQGRYIMRDFDKAKPMSNFLAGIAGTWGVPLWVFYVNRGQGITSFGVNDKNGGILKFETANRAYQQTAFNGFRTFLRGRRQGSPEWMYQPFFPDTGLDCGVPTALPQRDMMIGMNEMEIQEVQSSLGLQTNALYFIIPEEDFGGLVRRVTFSNINPDSDLELDVVDGLSKLQPFGVANGALNEMGRTMEGWMKVYNVDDGDFTRPFFHVTMSTGDVAQVQLIEEGHFVIAFIEGESALMNGDNEHELLPFIVDPLVVFGTDTTLTYPKEFFGNDEGVEGLLKKEQGITSRTPCSYTAAKLHIPAGKNVTVTSIYGHAKNLDEFLDNIEPVLRKSGFVTTKRARAKQIVDDIAAKVTTNTSSKMLNEYIKMDFLDNALRGGLPLELGDQSAPKIFHTFSRIHGDIERDYNWFHLDMTYYSQGPGNFRDVNQNRRVDVQLTPAVDDFNLRMFLSFVQMDGYNPLTVASTNFKIPSEKLDATLDALKLNKDDRSKTKTFLKKSFRPGKLFLDLRNAGVHVKDKQAFLQTVVAASTQEFAAQYAQNGFWIDHWTYTLDQLESFLTVFPDREEHVLWDSKPIPFFVSPALVRPRKDRYVVLPNKEVRAYNAVLQWGEAGFPKGRQELLNYISNSPDYIVDSNGAGGTWHRDKNGKVCSVNVVGKFAILAIIKFSTLDPYGMGVEMEGGKPGWNDAMNGLPGLIGSSMPETFEMLRIVEYLRKALPMYSRPVAFPSEFSAFMDDLDAALDQYSESAKDKQADFEYWNTTNNAREKYREQIVGFVKCKSVEWKSKDLLRLLDKIHDKTKAGIDRALALNNGMPPTYFYFDMVKRTEITVDDEVVEVVPEEFDAKVLPNFLEGPTRYMKVAGKRDKQREIYRAVRDSDLFDDKLKMFKICVNLAGLSPEVGRMVAFAPGWLENESIWLHMTYKFLLELVRAGMYEDFYNEIQVGLVPFMDNKQYGRSPLEASSFIVSSAFEDKQLHGQGFLARLSGSTAEFLSMWTLMMTGPSPFSLNSDGQLQLTLRPALAKWLFNQDNTLSFTWLSHTLVTYHNKEQADTWELRPCSGTIVTNDGEKVESTDGVFVGKVVDKIRRQKVKSIEVELCKA